MGLICSLSLFNDQLKIATILDKKLHSLSREEKQFNGNNTEMALESLVLGGATLFAALSWTRKRAHDLLEDAPANKRRKTVCNPRNSN